jgi:hypothetical protein
MALVVSRRPLNAKANFCALVSPCGICEQIGNVTGVSPSSSVFTLSVSFHRDSPFSYITWGVNNRPVGYSSSET